MYFMYEKNDVSEWKKLDRKADEIMKKNLLVAQSGSPSAAINATLCGVLEQGLADANIEKIYGVKNGIMGLLSERLINLTEMFSDKADLQLLCQTPSSILGSCHMKLSAWEENPFECERAVAILRKYRIGYFVYIGGSDSMDTVHKLSDYCKAHNIQDIQMIGVPKTVDNDLPETDHSPGFGSAAKYIGTTFSEIACDCSVYALPSITLVEIMGQETGWLTAASALARINGNGAPDLIYLCEKPFSIDRFLFDVREKMMEKHSIIIAVSEGLRNEEGEYLAESLQHRAEDAVGQRILASVSRFLEEILRKEIGCKVRSVELNLMQRCASHIASVVDIQEARRMGAAAVQYAVEGGSGEMVCLQRVSQEPYETEIFFVPIETVVDHVKEVPLEWIHEDGNDIMPEMMEYLLPLIQGEFPCTFCNGIPVHFHLPK